MANVRGQDHCYIYFALPGVEQKSIKRHRGLRTRLMNAAITEFKDLGSSEECCCDFATPYGVGELTSGLLN